MNKFLIAGLGNIGSEYDNTRHNIGFTIAEALLASINAGKDKTIAFSSGRFAHTAKFRYRGKPVTLIKPTTYMNLSGKAIHYWMQQEGIPIQNVLVVTDDIALPFGTIRIRKQGSDGGHNGLASIITTLGRNDFPRLRFGIGNEFAKGWQADFVLSNWSPEEAEKLASKIDSSIDAIKCILFSGIDSAMNIYNKRGTA